MIPLLDLATFPANQCPNDDYLADTVEVILRSRRRAEGVLFEFNGPKGFLMLQLLRSGKRVKIKFSDIKLLKFHGTIPRKVKSGQTFSGNVTFKDGSEWRGRVIYYLNDRYGLHLIAQAEKHAHRYFFPEDNIKDQQVSALFGQMLLDKTGLSEDDITSALAVQTQMRLEGEDDASTKLGAILQQSGKISEEEVQRSLARHLDLQFVSLKNEIPDQDAVELLTEELCKQLNVIPIAKKGNSVKIATVDPNSTEALNMVSFITGLIPEPVLTTQGDLEWTLDVYFRSDENQFDPEPENELKEIERASK